MSLPTALEVNYVTQTAFFAYEPTNDNVYMIGARNLDATPYMAAALVSKNTIYAGCSTLHFISGYAPLPQRVSLRALGPRGFA